VCVPVVCISMCICLCILATSGGSRIPTTLIIIKIQISKLTAACLNVGRTCMDWNKLKCLSFDDNL